MQEVQDELKDKVLEKEYEVSVLQNGIYQMEVLQEQFTQKDIEIEALMLRMAEAAEENTQL